MSTRAKFTPARLVKLVALAIDGGPQDAIDVAKYVVEHRDELVEALVDARTLAKVRAVAARDHANPAAYCKAVQRALAATP